jgi:hypothetical protein
MTKTEYIRYAYRHKKYNHLYGLLKAINYKDARKHLGSGYHIKKCVLSEDDIKECQFNTGYKRVLVNLNINKE